MTWEIVVGLIALVCFIGTVATWISKLSKVLTTLEVTIKSLDDTVRELKQGNKETHKELFGKLDEHEETLNDHEIRIHSLEERGHNK